MERDKKKIPRPPQLQSQGGYSWWMMTKTEVRRQTPRSWNLEGRLVTNTMRPLQETTRQAHTITKLF